MNLLLKMKRIKDLSPSERQVINYILNDPESAANMGIVEMSQKTYTSTSTVIRVCKKLGIDSFIDFRIQLSADLGEYIDHSLVLKYQAPIEPQDTLVNIINKVTSNNVRAIIDVKRFNSIEILENVVGMMNAARQIDFFGSGVSNLICQDAMMKALRLGIRSTAYSYYSEMAMLAKTTTVDHLAIIVSYTGQTEDTLRVAKYLQRGNVPSVSITGHKNNPLIDLCSVNLYIDSIESIYRIGGMRSRLSCLHLLDLLFSCYIGKNQDKLKDIMNRTFLPETFHNESES
jgi:RpiR family transcriptional regulator, murPQ operon repressor